MGLLSRAVATGSPSKERYNGASFTIAPNNGTIEFADFRVPKALRGNGVGRSVMERLESELDGAGFVAQLSPEALEKTTDVRKLRSFYREHGFVSNRGENRIPEIVSSMYRLPR